MKRTLLCLLLALTMLLAAGCADWEVTEDPLGELSDFYQNENEEPEPEPLTAFTLPYIAGGTLDPVRTTDTMQQTVESLLYQGLFALDEQFRPQAVLADSWTYDAAQRTWTIRIKADAAFSDGSADTGIDTWSQHKPYMIGSDRPILQAIGTDQFTETFVRSVGKSFQAFLYKDAVFTLKIHHVSHRGNGS